MRAMILAAGFGTRLWPLTIGRTKPAIPFLNCPLIAYTIDYLSQFGVSDLIVNLHHEPASVRDQIGDGSQYGVHISYSMEEPEILGTSGALDPVRDVLGQGTFIVINGKIITNLDLNAALATHRASGAIATLVLRPNPSGERFSEVLIDDQQSITAFGGFPDPDGDTSRPPLMFTGIQIMEPAILDFIPRGRPSESVRDVYPQLIAMNNHSLGAYVGEGEWHELSTLDRYLATSLEFLARRGDSWIAGSGCQIDRGGRVERSVLWNRVEVGEGAVLRECLVADDVRIPDGADYRRLAIIPSAIAKLNQHPDKALPGEILGENLVVTF
jgi:mannose-1-phosphate guanylyltransferase/phosphomannomutase